MDIDHRPHRDSTDLFVCFTSRFCSFSSAKMSSKSFFSPGCVDTFREPKLSSSSSLSRRLRASGSLKGGQSSPMLILSGSNKKRGYAFENPEPSSPKVTCIGQVRVKTRKQRARSDDNKQHRNQKWVQLPLTICEALRAFGAEFNCFMPCGGRSFCSSVRDSKSGKRTASSCGAVLARWLMAIQEEEEDEKKMEIESEEVKGEKTEVFGEIEIEKEEERVSICIPPKNALLLMRCRSDPVRISALANRFWDPQVQNDDEEDENSEEDGSEEEKTGPNDEQVQAELVLREEDEVENQDNSENVDTAVKEEEEEENEEVSPEKSDQEQEQQKEVQFEEEEEVMVNWSLFESFYQLETLEIEDTEEVRSQNRVSVEEEEMLPEYEESSSSVPSPPHQEKEEEEMPEQRLEEDSRENIENQTDEKIETEERGSESQTMLTHEKKTSFEEEEEESKSSLLPDCLLSMLCEPKLSMEISEETWVCSRDFIRWNSNKHHQVVNIINGSDEAKEKQVNTVNPTTTTKQQLLLPPRSSFSAAVAMQKLVSAVAHEPFVLTRCKSEPLRSSARLVPSWKNNQNLILQPHQRASLGVGRLLARPKC